MERKPVLASNFNVGDKYILKNHTAGYETFTDAQAEKNQHVSVLAGEYIIYNITNGMINITKIGRKSGFWINPNKVK